MAFNINAAVVLSGPKNLKKVRGEISKKLSGIKVKVDVKFKGGAVKQLQNLSKTLGNITAKLKTTQAAAIAATNAINKSTAATNAATSANQQFSKTTNNSAKNLNKVAKNVKDARNEIEAFGRDSALAIRRFSAFTIATGAIFGFVRSVQMGISEAIKFERELIRIVQVTGQSKSGLQGLQKTIDQLAVGLGISANKLVEVARTFAQTGQSLNQVEASLKAVARASLAPTFGTIESTTEGVIAALAQFNIKANKTEAVLGSLNAVSKRFAVESADLISVIRRAGGVFAAASSNLGKPEDALNDLISIFTAVRSTTRESADTIAVGLRTIFTRIQRPQTIEFLKQFGVEVTDAQGKFVGFFNAFKELSSKLGDLQRKGDVITFGRVVEELGGIRQVGKLIPAIVQFTKAEEARKVAMAGTNSITKDVGIATQTLQVRIEKLGERFNKLIRDITKSATFQSLANFALEAANAFVSLADALRPALPLLTTIATLKISSALFDFTRGFVGGLKKGGPGGSGDALGGFISGGGRGGGGGKPGAALGDSADKKQRQANISANTQAIKSNTLSLKSLDAQIKLLSGTSARMQVTAAGIATAIPTLISALNNVTAGFARASSGVTAIAPGKRRGGGGGKGPARRAMGGRVGSPQRFARGGVATMKPNTVGGLFLERGKHNTAGNIKINREKGVETFPSMFKDVDQIRAQIPLALLRPDPSNHFKNQMGPDLEKSIQASAAKTISQNFEFRQFDVDEQKVAKNAVSNIDLDSVYGHLFEAFTSAISGLQLSAPGDTFDIPSSTKAGNKRLNSFFESSSGPISSRILEIKKALTSENLRGKKNSISKKIIAGLGTSLTRGDFLIEGGKEKAASDRKAGQTPIKQSKNAARLKNLGVTRKVSTGGFDPEGISSLLTPQELVFNPRAVEAAGLSNLERFNKTGDASRLGNFNPADVGLVPGLGTGDIVPRTLEPGSFVVRKSSAKGSGLNEETQFFNRGGRAGRPRRKFQVGGAATGGGAAGLAQGALNLTILTSVAGGLTDSFQGLLNGVTSAIVGFSVLHPLFKDFSFFSKKVKGAGEVVENFREQGARARAAVKKRQSRRLNIGIASAIGALAIGPLSDAITSALGQVDIGGVKGFSGPGGRAKAGVAGGLTGAAQGAAAGVSVGIFAGPIGAAVAGIGGAVVGGILGLFSSLKEQSKFEEFTKLRDSIGAVSLALDRLGKKFDNEANVKDASKALENFNNTIFSSAQILANIEQKRNITIKGQNSLEAQLRQSEGGFGGGSAGGQKAIPKGPATLTVESLKDSLKLLTPDQIKGDIEKLAALEDAILKDLNLKELKALSKIDTTNINNFATALDLVDGNADGAVGSIRGAADLFKQLATRKVLGSVRTFQDDLSKLGDGKVARKLDDTFGKAAIKFIEVFKTTGAKGDIKFATGEAQVAFVNDIVKNLNTELSKKGSKLNIGEVLGSAKLSNGGGFADSIDNFQQALINADPEKMKKLRIALGPELSAVLFKAAAASGKFTESVKTIGVTGVAARAGVEAAIKGMNKLINEIDALGQALSALSSQTSRAVSDFSVAFGNISSSISQITGTGTTVTPRARGNVFNNIAGRSSAELDAGVARISNNVGSAPAFKGIGSTIKFTRDLPNTLKSTVDSLRQRAGKNNTPAQEFSINTILKEFEKQAGGEFAKLPPVLQEQIRAQFKAQLSGGRQNAKLGVAGLRKKLEGQPFKDLVASLGGIGEQARESLAKTTAALNEFNAAVIKAANFSVAISNEKAKAEQTIIARRIQFEEKFNKFTNKNVDKQKDAQNRLRATLQGQVNAGGAAGGLPPGLNVLNGQSLLDRRLRLEKTKTSLQGQIQAKQDAKAPVAEISKLIDKLGQNAVALDGTKRALETLSKDVTELSAIEADLSRIQEARLTARQRAQVFASRIGAAKTKEEQNKAATSFFKPVFAALRGFGVGGKRKQNFGDAGAVLSDPKLIQDTLGLTDEQLEQLLAKQTKAIGIGGKNFLTDRNLLPSSVAQQLTLGNKKRGAKGAFGAGTTEKGKSPEELKLLKRAKEIEKKQAVLTAKIAAQNAALILVQQQLFRSELEKTSKALIVAGNAFAFLRGLITGKVKVPAKGTPPTTSTPAKGTSAAAAAASTKGSTGKNGSVGASNRSTISSDGAAGASIPNRPTTQASAIRRNTGSGSGDCCCCCEDNNRRTNPIVNQKRDTVKKFGGSFPPRDRDGSITISSPGVPTAKTTGVKKFNGPNDRTKILPRTADNLNKSIGPIPPGKNNLINAIFAKKRILKASKIGGNKDITFGGDSKFNIPSRADTEDIPSGLRPPSVFANNIRKPRRFDGSPPVAGLPRITATPVPLPPIISDTSPDGFRKFRDGLLKTTKDLNKAADKLAGMPELKVQLDAKVGPVDVILNGASIISQFGNKVKDEILEAVGKRLEEFKKRLDGSEKNPDL